MLSSFTRSSLAACKARTAISRCTPILSTIGQRTVYSDEQRAKGRFTSPCLSIYHIHMGSVSSGAHRLTGMGLVGGIGLVGLGAFVSDPIQWVEWLKGHGILLWCTKFLTSYCVLYHFAGGLRHMYFEYFPEQLTFKSIISSSWVLYLGTAVVCIGLASWTLKPKAKKAIKA